MTKVLAGLQCDRKAEKRQVLTSDARVRNFRLTHENRVCHPTRGVSVATIAAAICQSNWHALYTHHDAALPTFSRVQRENRRERGKCRHGPRVPHDEAVRRYSPFAVIAIYANNSHNLFTLWQEH